MNWLKFLNLMNRSAGEPHLAHMTWARKGMGRSVSRTRHFLTRHLWIRPLIAVVLLAIVGFGMRTAIEQTMKANLRSGLRSLRDLETAMLLTWFEMQESIAESQANNLELRLQVYSLLDDEGSDEQTKSEAQKRIEKRLGPALTSHDFDRYLIFDNDRKIVAASEPSLIGQEKIIQYNSFLDSVFEGTPTVSAPFPSVIPLPDSRGELHAGNPTMYVSAPIRDENFQVIGALAFQIRPERDFTRILQLGRVGNSGEMYAFNADGTMVSNSRFDDKLIMIGLIPDTPDSQSLLNLQVRDPGVDMTEGKRPERRRAELPLTRMAQDAIAGNTNEDLEGYRDYRGVSVVGGWTWLPKYGIGLAVEVDVAQAYRPLTIIQRTFWGMFALLGFSAIAILIFTSVVERLKREAQKATIKAQQLGQYTLEEKLGSGGMGVVYKAYHAMLRRPTAVKMLDVDLVNDDSIARFEREVQITCKLNNPNTIAIYDYGRTPEGVFYYAMEYLDGIDLQTLVERYGPQPESRVIHLLLQICDSLYEAHSLGLVHRDIKPANIMLNRRGGAPDVVKVLDFGLVKAVDDVKQVKLTSANSLTGTPLYMSPEAIRSPDTVDGRSDLYAVGAVGFYLLTGRAVFQSTNIVEMCNMHLTATPEAPSKFTNQPVSPELEHALMVCLEKSISKRPQTARDLAALLKRSPQADIWSFEQAEAWWSRHEREQHISSPKQESSTEQPSPLRTGDPLDRTVIGDDQTT
ncbi:MAG: serine/threonine protein kinase [Planctomycetota bacterium]|nr:serine/threonine protein kinase [Planctomycetota bacterium]MDA1214822.1 serine/threonine protein kinase [Planctomycetota bacterium]